MYTCTFANISFTRMKIAVNTRFLIKDKLEGIGRFTYETLKNLVLQHPEHEFIFLFDREFDPDFLFAPNVKGIKLSPPARHPLLFIWFFELSIYQALKHIKPDIFLSCDGFLCLRTKVPQIAVIHDLAFEHYPEDVRFAARNYYHYFFPRFAAKAKHICTVSEFSKQDIISKYNIEENKISVIYNGASEIFRPISSEIKESVKRKYTLGENYFVYVGALQPRKNISRLLQAYDQFCVMKGPSCKLLIVGRKAWKTKEIEDVYASMQFRDSVIFTGWIADEELAGILGSALALTYIPYLEGFGIPILEAMQCGTPVITGNITAMPEVAGDAGILINPFDTDEIAKAMNRLNTDEKLRTELSARALVQAKKFSWKSTAEKLWNSIISV
jgi:glycosyltransferase involved in cell wall biosynthesis